METFHLVLNILVTAIVFLATLLPLLKHEHWTVRFFDFPYVQFTFLNAVIIVSWWLYLEDFNALEIGFISLLLVGLLYRVWIIFPYTTLSKQQALTASDNASSFRLKIVSANVLMYNDDYQGLLDLISEEKPDMLLLVETDDKWEEAVRASFKNAFSYHILKPLDNTYGMLLYSRFPLESSHIKYLIEEDVPSIETTVKLPDGQHFKFYGLHPKPPSPSQNDTSLPRDAELVVVSKKVRKLEIPVMVAGDLNDVAWSHTTRLFIRNSGLLDPRVGRGFFNTYPANHPLLRWPLDHMFVSSEFQIIRVSRLANFHSDHFPMCMEVLLHPHKKSEKNVQHPDEQDSLEGEDKIKRAGINQA